MSIEVIFRSFASFNRNIKTGLRQLKQSFTRQNTEKIFQHLFSLLRFWFTYDRHCRHRSRRHTCARHLTWRNSRFDRQWGSYYGDRSGHSQPTEFNQLCIVWHFVLVCWVCLILGAFGFSNRPDCGIDFRNVGVARFFGLVFLVTNQLAKI